MLEIISMVIAFIWAFIVLITVIIIGVDSWNVK